MYAKPSAGQAAPPTQPSSDSNSQKASSESDESWVDVGKPVPVVLDSTDPLSRHKRWYPFSEGPRSCVGQSLANMNLTGTLATLLAHFHFRLADQVMMMPISVPACACLHHNAGKTPCKQIDAVAC